MEATEEAEPSDHAIILQDGAKHSPSETSQRGQSWRSEGTVGPQEERDNPPADMGSQVLASGNTLKCHIQLRQKKSTQSAPPPESDAKTSDAPQRKSIKAGKYVCQYCGRACAKPSVLKKHIRSHTGERPYPCVPCGFSFKTKSNLYKHRKSHTHAVKAGLASFSGRGEKQEIVGEMHSDAGQSSESDEDVLEEATESQITASGRNEKPSHKSETTSPGKVSLWQFRERLPPVASAHVDQMIEFSTIKQRLALRLSEKKSHESEASLSLPGSYSKSSTDSGYFSRSDSAEQQLHPANSSAKSYQEIMFGKCYRPSAKKSITVQSCTTDSSDSTPSFTIKPSRSFRPSDADRQGLQKDLVTSGKAESFQEDDQQHLLEASGGVFLRSNSLPSSTSLDAAQALRSTHSFDERMTAADASCRGAAGMRRLRRQAAFEHCTNECDCHSPLTCSLKSDSLLLSGDDSRMTAESHQDMDQCALSLWPDSSTRKRRKDKAGTDEEDLPTSHSSRSSETAVETACSEAEGRERRNVISVIQHTNSLISSRTSPDVRSCSAESELCGGGWRIDAGLKFQKQLFSQTSITVPEIRVTVEPDRPKKLLDVAVEPKDKHVEEFQWPQRSQTLSQFPVEKLPPKKKRLRLAEMECSSGESSFESACTSLSRSPSQDSNLSHGSGFSQSQERDETHNVTSQTEEASKPLELLSVPGCSAGVHREMRRSASEQAPHKTAPEVAGLRSKSVDLGSLSASWPGDIAERRKVFLIRQATLSESATPDTFSPGETMMKRTASHMLFSVEAAMEKTTLSLLDNPFHQHKPFVQGPEQAPIPKADALHDLDHVRRLLAKEPAEFRSVKPFVSLSGPRSDCSPSVARVLSAIAQQASVAQASSGVLVPVRIQMQVPLYGNITYTSISHILESQTRTEQDTPGQSPAGGAAHPPAESPAKLKTGFPLSLTSKTISTTEAPSGGASKRMLSPASSLELVSKQQKRIKEDNIYGQIVKELSAVGLGNPEDESPQTSLIPEDPSDVPYLPGEVEMDEVLPDSFTNPQRCPRSGPGGDAVMEPAPDDPTSRPRSAPSTVPSVKAAGALFFSKLPGLHTSAHVSWCFLSCPKPNSWQTSGGFSEYSSWLVKSQNPNPLDLSTATVLALLRSKQAKQSLVYSVASMCQPGLLVTAIPEKRKQGHVVEYNEEDPKREVRLKETSQKGKSSREDVSSATRQQEQARVKICEGGYKSSEEYVYVRGRGRGKYICEECGIRCKKPSMLKKHIRTHTDVRPYVCKCCNFAFKTKGNLTKHMKSKAHVKKCLELGVEQTEEADENQKTLSVVGTSSKRQFSDVEDSDGADEDGEEPDDDEDEEDDGDSTPKTLSRSTSPQLGGAIRSGGLSEALTTRLTPGGPSSTFEDDLERWSASVEPCPPHLLSSRRDSPGQLYVQPPLLLPDTLTAPSPRGDSSPTRQPSPSPLGHQRCLLRAVSPRRASCQPKSPGDQRRSVRVPSATAGDRRSDPGDQSTSVKSDIFSHLPLHSQGQVPTTAPMMPIGGLRMPSTCPSAAPAPHEETARPHPPTDLDLRDKEGLCFCEQAIASLTLTSGEAAGSPQNS